MKKYKFCKNIRCAYHKWGVCTKPKEQKQIALKTPQEFSVYCLCRRVW